MTFLFEIHTPSGNRSFEVEPGSSLFFLGANGGGKTRLAAHIESLLGANAHRIAAHRALTFNPAVTKISEQLALGALRNGLVAAEANIGHRQGQRWQNKAETALLTDYDYVLQALFADQVNTSLQTHKNARAGNGLPAELTKFERLVKIWKRILPQRHLEVTGDDVQVRVGPDSAPYPASDMSDGERAAFYMMGQTLLAADDSLIIFDEPELHIHRAIMARLWDELEAARPDCAFLVISHDLEFVASRQGQKFVIRDFVPSTGWTIDDVPEDSGFSEEIATLILGSRRPILFVEGAGGSLDQAIYRACYSDWTVIPRGSCEEVIHAVVTMGANKQLTRIRCAGIVDADDYSPGEIDHLSEKGIAVLPVSEIENLFLLPDVVYAIAKIEGHKGTSVANLRNEILDQLFAVSSDPRNKSLVVMRYGRRRIDRLLKKIDLKSSRDVATLCADYTAKTSALDIVAIVQSAESAIDNAIASRNVAELLKWYDDKGILNIACRAKGTNKPNFEQWLVRALRNGTAPKLSAAIKRHLPKLKAT